MAHPTPQTEGGGGHTGFAVANPVGVDVRVAVLNGFVSEHYLMNKWVYFDQTYIDTMLGGRKYM